MPWQQRDACLRTNIPPILATPTHNKFTLLQQNHTSTMKIQHGRLKYRCQFEGQLKESLIVYQTFLRKWGHIHLHYPSDNPHDGQAVQVDVGAGAGGDL